MNSKKSKKVKRQIKKFLLKLNPLNPSELSSDKGVIIFDPLSRRVKSKKDKKRKGRKRGDIVHPKMKWSQIIKEGLEPQEYWDDWSDSRDSMRRWYEDNTLYKNKTVGWKHDYNPKEINAKLDKELAIRKAAKKKK